MLARTRPRLAAELSLTALSYLLSSSAYHMWWGGSSAPARFAVPVLPLLVLPGAWIWKSARHSGTRAIGFALLVLSIGLTAIAVIVDGGQLAYNFRDGYSRVGQWLSPLVDLPQALPSFFRQTPGTATMYASIWVVSIALAWLALKQLTSRSKLAAAAPPALAIAVMASATLVWKLQNVAGPTPDASGLSLLEHADARLRPLGFDLSHAGFVPRDTLVSRVSISTTQERPAPPPGTLLLVPDVLPAGTYDLVVGNPAAAEGMATLVIGRNARPVESWNLGTDLRDGALRFHLPVDVGSIVIKGDDGAVRHGGAMSLRAIDLLPRAQRLTGDYARRVEPYGPALVYFFDDEVFAEQPGFWVRGGAAARFATMSVQPGAAVQLFIRNAAVDNRVRVSIDGRTEELELKPREERPLPIPAVAGRRASLITVDSDSGFRPSQVEPGSTDNRYLGVWIELRP